MFGVGCGKALIEHIEIAGIEPLLDHAAKDLDVFLLCHVCFPSFSRLC
jgi:hypothetical protein